MEILAYVGPGLGAGAVAAVLGALAAIFLGLFSFLWFPVKRMLKKFKKNKEMPAVEEIVKSQDS